MSYNGWSNRATWLVNLHFGEWFSSPEFGTTEADELEATIWQYLEDGITDTMSGLTGDIVLSFMAEVDWEELSKHYSEED